jgi:hypothetical protein
LRKVDIIYLIRRLIFLPNGATFPGPHSLR